MIFYIYEFPKCLLTWENAQCIGGEDGDGGDGKGDSADLKNIGEYPDNTKYGKPSTRLGFIFI